jgi:hypothetical protein
MEVVTAENKFAELTEDELIEQLESASRKSCC